MEAYARRTSTQRKINGPQNKTKKYKPKKNNKKITTKTHAKTNQKYERTDNIHNACNVTSVTVT